MATPLELMRAVSGTAEVRWMQDGQLHIHASDDATTFVRQLLVPRKRTSPKLEMCTGQPSEAPIADR